MTLLSHLPDPEPVDRQEVVRVSQESAGIEREVVVQVSQASDVNGAPALGGRAMEHREETVRDVAGNRRLRVYQGIQGIWFLTAFLEGAIGLRVVLKLIGANPDNGFASVVYGFTGLFVGPFAGLIGTPASGGMVLEISSMIAMVVYALGAWAVVRAVRLAFAQGGTRTSSTYDRSRF